MALPFPSVGLSHSSQLCSVSLCFSADAVPNSHNNIGWQGYSAAPAPTYAESLKRIEPEMEWKIAGIIPLRNYSRKDLNGERNTAQDTSDPSTYLGFEQKRYKIERWVLALYESTSYIQAMEQWSMVPIQRSRITNDICAYMRVGKENNPQRWAAGM